MNDGAARAFVALLCVALFVAFVQGGVEQMRAWLWRTLTGDKSVQPATGGKK